MQMYLILTLDKNSKVVWLKLEFLDFETCEVRKVSQPVLESIDTNISINMATLEKMF